MFLNIPLFIFTTYFFQCTFAIIKLQVFLSKSFIRVSISHLSVYQSLKVSSPCFSFIVQDSEWVDIVESELRSILEPRDVPAMAHSTLSESVSSVTPPLPPLSPHDSPRTPRNRYSTR